MQNLLCVFDIAEPEAYGTAARGKVGALLLLGAGHWLTAALADAITEPAALIAALADLDALPALPSRRLLATLAAVLPARAVP